MSAPHAATAAALRVALIPNYLGAASRRHSPSASECDERFVAPDELLRIGADHVSAPVELARPNGVRAAHRSYAPAGCEVDLDDLCARLRQGARKATSAPAEGQRAEVKR